MEGGAFRLRIRLHGLLFFMVKESSYHEDHEGWKEEPSGCESTFMVFFSSWFKNLLTMKSMKIERGASGYLMGRGNTLAIDLLPGSFRR